MILVTDPCRKTSTGYTHCLGSIVHRLRQKAGSGHCNKVQCSYLPNLLVELERVESCLAREGGARAL
jgi:hypothetical protein